MLESLSLSLKLKINLEELSYKDWFGMSSLTFIDLISHFII